MNDAAIQPLSDAELEALGRSCPTGDGDNNSEFPDNTSDAKHIDSEWPTMGEQLLGFTDFQFRCAWEEMDDAGRAKIEPDTRVKCITRYRKLTSYVDKTNDKLRRTAEPLDKTTKTVWSEPLDIFSSVQTPAFQPQDFPAMITDYAQRFSRSAGFDFSATALACVAAAAAMIPDHVRVLLARRSSWFESARLWVLLVGGPGTGKTPIIRAATRPVKDLHARLTERWHAENPDPSPDKHVSRPATYTSDATTEKLSELLRDNPGGLLYIVEEFETWLGSFDAYRSSGSRDRGEWLRLYDGGPHQVDRIKRGSYYVPNWGVSLIAATTWATLEKNVKHLPADGLLQRLLPVLLSGERPEPDPLIVHADVHRAEQAFESRLLELHERPETTVRLTEDALEHFDEEVRANRKLVSALESSGEGLAAHVAKHAALLGRVALTFHAIEHGPALASDLTGETMLKSISFMRRVFAHTVAFHQRIEPKSSAWPLARDLARSILADGITVMNARTASQICRSWRTAEDWKRRQAVGTLTTCGWLLPVDPFKRYGDHGAAWDVNPMVADTFARIGEQHVARRKALHERLRSAEGIAL